MKNLKFFLGGLAVAAMIFTSCEEEKTNPVAENGSATISGVAYVDLDVTNDTNTFEIDDYEFVPEGTVLYAKLSTKDLTLVPSSATYADQIIETTVGTNGAYSFTVPANSKSFSVTITGDDIIATHLETDPIDPDAKISHSQKYTLEATAAGNIHDGVIRIVNLFYE